MKEFWDQRFNRDSYVYGVQASAFLKSELPGLPVGRVLFPGEGEGRNAVYAASLGWEVSAFDQSNAGKSKAMQLAEKKGVKLDYQISSYIDFEVLPDQFDAIVLIYTHMPSKERKLFHQKMIHGLKPGGTILLEGFSKQQLGKTSGGPQNPDMLFSEEELRSDFSVLKNLIINEMIVSLDEGEFHRGEAFLIRCKGIKSR